MENVSEKGKQLIRDKQLIQLTANKKIEEIDKKIVELEKQREAQTRIISEMQGEINRIAKEYSK